MTWKAQEVDPTACQHCARELPGSGHLRAVNVRSRPRNSAPPFHCGRCEAHIGKTRIHYIVGERVVCGRCQHEGTMYTRAAAAVTLGIWP